MSYQDQVGQLKDAGFSGQDIQGWSDNQAVKLRQGGFSQDEVNDYQGMKPPAPGQPPVYGRLPTDDDFKNAASVILKGNDHPWYQKAVDMLKGLNADTGVDPAQAVKAAQKIPSFREIMENGGSPPSPSWSEYGSAFMHGAGSAVSSGMQGLAAAHAYLNPDDQGMPQSEIGTNPETTQMYQKGTALQKWIDQKYSVNPETAKNNPTKMALAEGAGSFASILGGPVGMALPATGQEYEQAKQAGSTPEQASSFATKAGALWGALGVVDIGMFLKPIERAAPGAMPWVIAKMTQMLRGGATMVATNELGDKLSSEIAQASDIPIQYKPTLQRIVVNAALGSVAGGFGPTSVKRGETAEKPLAEQPTPTEGQSQPSTAPAASLTPAYHFDSDSYGLKNENGEFVQHGFGSEEEAARMGQMQDKVIPPGPSRLEPEVIDRYKKTISDLAEKNNIPFNEEQLQVAATKMAESHNPLKPLEVTPRELKEPPIEEKTAEQPKQKALAEKAPEQGELFKKHDEDFLYQKNSLNRGILTAKRELPPEAHELLDFIDRIAPGAKVKFVNALEGGAHGMYDPLESLITMAKTSPDQWNTAGHESTHHIEHLLTDKEWQTLVDEANSKKLFEKYDIGRYEKQEQHDSEMIAHWAGDYFSGKRMRMSPEARTIFEKVKDIIASVAKKLRELFGNQSAEDILEKIYSGEVGRRTEESESGRESPEGSLYQKAGEEEKKPTLGDAIRGIRDTISPTSAGDLAKREEVSIRGAYGEAKRERAIAETALNEFARQANKMTPEDHADFYSYVEGRSKGTQLQNKQFQAMADTVRDIYSRYKDLIQAMPETRMQHFVSDYFTHQWAEGQDKKIQEFMNSWWQQGSGRNLKERKIPTIADGLAYGLKLAEPNPVRAVSRYAGSMSNYLASVKVLRTINNDLGGGYYADGKQPEGYAALVGKNAERIENARLDAESGKIVPARTLHLYAPKQVADLYNAFYSKGFEDTKLKPAYMLARNAINTNTLMELGLSAYHASTITMQSLNQDMGRFLRNALAGDWQGVGDAVKGLVTPTLHFHEGSKLMEQYKDLEDHGIDMQRMADEFTKSNLRIGLDPLSNVSTHGGFYKAWQRGELPQVIDRMKRQMTEGYGIGALKSGAEAVARVVSDVSHPLFNVYVPAIKMSAFHDLMGDWLRQNKGATDGEIAQARVRIGDMVEDRFGEMNMENLFWNKKVKELMGLGLRAPGWDLGLVRQVGGAGYDVYRMIKDGIKGKGFDTNRLDRPLFMAGAVIVYAAINSAMTYIKTGVAPDDQKLKDLIAYATGGLHKAFGIHPERAELPGHGRELIQMYPVPGQGPLSGITQEAANKVATLPKKTYEAATNTDWNGKPIYDPKSKNWYQRIPGVAQAVHIASGFEPFSMEQLFGGAPEGSKLSLAERFMGVRAAGAKIVNPQGLKEFNERKRH